LKGRGAHQRRAFHTYYQHFGLTEPFPLATALQAGLVESHPDPGILSRADAYDLTHEVFAAYEYGDALDQDPFGERDRAYLRSAIPQLAALWRSRHDPDLVAELVACMRYLGNVGHAEYRASLSYLLGLQNPDGSWGTYESQRARLGDYVKQGFYLHTVAVVVDALTLAFEDTFRRHEDPTCPM
jgi:hypothetical protein